MDFSGVKFNKDAAGHMAPGAMADLDQMIAGVRDGDSDAIQAAQECVIVAHLREGPLLAMLMGLRELAAWCQGDHDEVE